MLTFTEFMRQYGTVLFRYVAIFIVVFMHIAVYFLIYRCLRTMTWQDLRRPIRRLLPWLHGDNIEEEEEEEEPIEDSIEIPEDFEDDDEDDDDASDMDLSDEDILNDELNPEDEGEVGVEEETPDDISTVRKRITVATQSDQ